jgi:polysaccharide pyruvyl transferase WcaK-like protein
LINSSWFRNDEHLTKRLDAFELVALRESQSHATVAAEGVTCRMVPDLAISEAIDCKTRLTNAPTSGFMVSDSTRPEITRQLERFSSKRGWRYLPVLARPVERRPSAKSRRIHRRVQMAGLFGPLARIFLTPRYRAHCLGVTTPEEYCRALAGVRGVVTGRFHTACFALGLEVPMMVVASNTPKIESVLGDAGLDTSRRVVNLAELDKISEVPPISEAELGALRSFLDATRNAHRELFSSLRKLVVRSP